MLFKALLVLYNLVLIVALLLPGLQGSPSAATWIVGGLVAPPLLYFLLWILKRNGFFDTLRQIFFWLSLATTTVLFAFNLLGALAAAEYLMLLPLLPLPLYFWGFLIARFARRSAAPPAERGEAPVMKRESEEAEETGEEKAPSTAKAVIDRVEELEGEEAVVDRTRRDFLRKIGGVGIGLLIYSLLNPREAGAAFFGSVPGGGTVGLRDTAGTQIDPAEKYPTSGYGISEIDDAGTTFYYGFVDKGGSWYILKEVDSSGDFNYRYASGGTDFPTNWTNRTALTYGYFDATF